MKKQNARRRIILLLAFLLTCTACSTSDKGSEIELATDTPAESVHEPIVEAEATTMSLMKTEGTVGVSDGNGKDVPPFENMKLYSGYQLETQPVSYAWINLDSVKLAKMDENSEVGIRKEGKDLTIFLNAGGLYFNISEPLPEDETFNIRCSTMVVGIRGTCGWVQLLTPTHMQIHLLEGTVECQITSGTEEPETITVSGGEMADLIVNDDGETEITILPFAENYVAPFVLEELKADAELCETILEVSGLDILDPPDPVERLKEEYATIITEKPVFDKYVSMGLSYATYYDLDSDGSAELLLLTSNTAYDSCSYHSLEVYGDVQGHAQKYDEIIFDELPEGTPEYMDEYVDDITNLALITNENKTYICFNGDIQDAHWYAYYVLEDGALKAFGEKPSFTGDYEAIAANDMSPFGDFSQYAWLEGETLPENICSKLPENVQRKNAFLDEMRYGTEYARLIDMNQDGVEDLLEYDNGIFSTHIWNGTDVETISLDYDGTFSPEMLGIYQEKITGEIYVYYSGWQTGSMEVHEFVGLSDSIRYEISIPIYGNIFYDHVATEDETDRVDSEYAERNQAVYDEMENRFELIEKMYPGNDYSATVEAVKQYLLER